MIFLKSALVVQFNEVLFQILQVLVGPGCFEMMRVGDDEEEDDDDDDDAGDDDDDDGCCWSWR